MCSLSYPLRPQCLFPSVSASSDPISQYLKSGIFFVSLCITLLLPALNFSWYTKLALSDNGGAFKYKPSWSELELMFQAWVIREPVWYCGSNAELGSARYEFIALFSPAYFPELCWEFSGDGLYAVLSSVRLKCTGLCCKGPHCSELHCK